MRTSGRETRPLQLYKRKTFSETGGYGIRPYDIHFLQNQLRITHYELRIELIPHSEFLIPN